MGKYIFFIFVVAVMILGALFVKNRKRYFLTWLPIAFTFPAGVYIHHYNGIMLPDIALFALFFIGISSGRFKFYISPVSLPILGLIVWSTLSAVQALNVGWAITEVTSLIRAYLVLLVIVNLVKTPKDLKVTINALLIGFAIQTLIGIHQWRLGPVGLSYLGERVYRVQWRSMGTFYVPSYYGNYLIFILPILFRLFMFYKPPNKMMTKIYGGLLALGVIAMFSSYTRGPWISFVASITLITVFSMFQKKFRPKTRWAIVIFIIFAGAFALKYGDKVISQFSETRQASADIRYDQWRIASRVIRAYPIFGTGFENYEFHSPDFLTDEDRLNVKAWQFSEMVHNSYLYMAAQTGIPGGIMFLFWFFFVFKKGFTVLKSKSLYISNLAIGIMGGFFATMLSYMYSPDIHSLQTLYQFWIMGGLIYALANMDKKLELQQKRMSLMSREKQQRNSKTPINFPVNNHNNRNNYYKPIGR